MSIDERVYCACDRQERTNAECRCWQQVQAGEMPMIHIISVGRQIDSHAIRTAYDQPAKLDMQPGKVQYATRGTPE